MSNRIVLLGDIGDKFDTEWYGEFSTIADAVKLIACQTVGLKKYIVDAMDSGLDVAIMVGDELITSEVELAERVFSGDIYLTLIPAGSKAGFGKLLAALAIAVFAIFVPVLGPGLMSGGFLTAGQVAVAQSVLFGIAANLALAGVAELLTKIPGTADAEDEGKVFGGPSSTIKQGNPVPLLYGQLLISGANISTDFSAGEIRDTVPASVLNFGITTVSGGGVIDTTTEETIITQVQHGGGGGARVSGLPVEERY